MGESQTETTYRVCSPEELRKRALDAATRLQAPGFLEGHYRSAAARKEEYRKSSLSAGLLMLGISVALLAVGAADVFGKFRVPGGFLFLIGGAALSITGLVRISKGFPAASPSAPVIDPVLLSRLLYRSALQADTDTASTSDRLINMEEAFPPTESGGPRLPSWEPCYQEVKTLLTGSAEPDQPLVLQVEASADAVENVGEATVSIMRVAVNRTASTASPVLFSNAAIQVAGRCFLLLREPGHLVTLDPDARTRVASALRHKMASTRNVAARCLKDVPDPSCRKMLEAAAAREQVPWAKAEMEAALRPADDSRVPCRECGAMILPETAERTEGFCAPCARGKS